MSLKQSPNFVPKPALILGTAQLGMPYGVANTSGRPAVEESLKIVRKALQNGICFFDTAQSYGESEERLGFCFKELGVTKKVRVFSKIHSDSSSTKEQVAGSLKKLCVEKLYGLLLQGGWKDEFCDQFEKLKSEGLIEHAGISIYDQEAFETALQVENIDFIQIPFNIFDQRALKNGWFEKAKRKNKKIIIRSVYLQGLLLMRLEQLPPHLSFAKPFLKEYLLFCRHNEVSPREMALNFVVKYAQGSPVIFGIEKAEQLIENIKLFNKALEKTFLEKISFSTGDFPEKLINPSLWQKTLSV